MSYLLAKSFFNSMNWLKELKKTIENFIKKCGIDDELVSIPKSVKKLGLKVEFLSICMTIFSLFFAFVLKYANVMIEMKFFLLGIILFMLYRGERIIRDSFNIYADSEATKFELMFEDEMVYKASIIIGKVKDKVLKYDEKNKIYKVMSNESILNALKNYLKNLWNHNLKHRFDVIEIFSVFIMIIVAIITNDAIPNSIFIILILFFSVFSFLSTVYIEFKRDDYYHNNKKYNNEQSVLINDLLRVPSIVDKDLEMRINRFKETVINSNNNLKGFFKTRNITRLIITFIDTFSEYGIIIIYIINLKLSNLTLSSIAEITATLAIVETAMRYIKRIVYTLDYNNERINALKNEEEDIKLILDTYYLISNHKNDTKIDNIILRPFEIKYFKNSNNDIPFTLTLNDQININCGDVLVLYGPSGSGKSTFMNMLTQRIKIEKSYEIPYTSRFLFYDEKLKFGSVSLYEELFCDTKADLKKMEDILRNLNLWNEISDNCKDVWKYMKEKKFDNSLSNGQKQRLIIAKILYFLDNEIDALVLDECTSGLDDKDKNSDNIDAVKILEYIVRYANKDKKRIVIISTHQNIDEFKKNIRKDFNVRNFVFNKEKEGSTIKEF